jgi:hypothetical protein
MVFTATKSFLRKVPYPMDVGSHCSRWDDQPVGICSKEDRPSWCLRRNSLVSWLVLNQFYNVRPPGYKLVNKSPRNYSYKML